MGLRPIGQSTAKPNAGETWEEVLTGRRFVVRGAGSKYMSLDYPNGGGHFGAVGALQFIRTFKKVVPEIEVPKTVVDPKARPSMEDLDKEFLDS